VGEVTGQGIDVLSGGTPNANWYCQFRSGSRFVRGTFGYAGQTYIDESDNESPPDFVWSLSNFITGSKGAIGTVLVTAEGAVIAAPVWSVAPTISGTAKVGLYLSLTSGTVSGSPTLTYQWARAATLDGVYTDIPGAITASHLLTTAELAQYIKCRITATNAGGVSSITTLGVGAVAPADVITEPLLPLPTFTLENWGASSSAGFMRFGTPFQIGAVPSGFRVAITRSGSAVAAQFDEVSRWPDGSLRFAVCHLRDTAFSAAESRTYQFVSEAGAFDNTGDKALDDVSQDFTVEFSTLTQFNGSSTATRGSGAALASFAAHKAAPTRATKVHSGPVCEGWMAWGMARDGAGGAGSEDAHLKTIWYVDLWKNADGSIADTEVCAVVSQDWWAVPSKFRLNYTATLKDGATTIETYASVQHPYHSQWATVRKTADNNHARRHWMSAVPTLTYKPSKSYWVATGLVPPLDTTFTPNSNATIGYTSTYTPCGAQNHRAAVNGTGAYIGRGMLPNPDAVAFMRQTAQDMRYARTNAFAGLHIPYHFRSSDTRSRPSESADVANTVCPLELKPNPTSNWAADGMPTTRAFYRGGSHDAAFVGAYTYVSPTGGAGVWTIATGTNVGGADHAVAYSYFMYLHEGERYFMEAQLDLATNTVHELHSNAIAGAPWLPWYEVVSQRTALSIPSTRYSGIAGFQGRNNIRAMGFANMLLGYASAIVPDSDVQRRYIREFVAHNAAYGRAVLNYMPAAVFAAGTWYDTNGTGVISPWFNALCAQGAYMHYNCTRDTNARDQGDHFAKVSTAAFLADRIYWSGSYRALMGNKTDSVDPSVNPYRAYGDMLSGPTPAVCASGVFTLTDSPALAPPRNGDEVVFVTKNESLVTVALPSGYTAGTVLYAVNCSGFTFQVASTPGGVPVVYPNGTYQAGVKFDAMGDYTVAQFPPYLPGSDSFYTIQRAALVMANRAGYADADAAAVARANTFLAPVDYLNWVTWKLAA